MNTRKGEAINKSPDIAKTHLKPDFSKGIGKVFKRAEPSGDKYPKPMSKIAFADIDADIVRELEKVRDYCREAGKRGQRDVGKFTFQMVAQFCALLASSVGIFIKQGDSKTAIEYAYKLGRCYEKLRSSEITRKPRRASPDTVPGFLQSIPGWREKTPSQLRAIAQRQFPNCTLDNLIRQIRRLKKSGL